MQFEREDDRVELQFGGYPVELRKVDDDVLIRCKNVIGTYKQYIDFKNKKNDEFGLKESEKCKFEFSIMYKNGLKIGCLDGTRQEKENLINKCEILLNKKS